MLEEHETGRGAEPTTPAEGAHGTVTVKVNTKPVTLAKHRNSGLEIKDAAIAQGVEIERDFILTREAREGRPAETIADDREIAVTKNDEFIANDGDDDS